MSVEVKLELGHRAGLREKKTAEGFTHDWTVFVRGAEGSNIQYFVEKVVFYLHESFPKPKRVIKDPPYSVSESGYAGFLMPIEVYFRTKEEPKKVRFKYDLFLRLECPPVHNIRIEKLTFQNPSDEFRTKLLKAGGVGALTGAGVGSASSLQTQACLPPAIPAPPQPPPPPPLPVEDHPPPQAHPKVAEKKQRTHQAASKDIPKPPPPAPPPVVAPKPSQPFTDIFGPPIRTKNSPDSNVKTKEAGHSSQSKSKSSSSNSAPTNSSGKEAKSSTKESHHKGRDSHHKSKESHHSSKEVQRASKESNHHLSTEGHSLKETHHPTKDAHPSKEAHHSTKEAPHLEKEIQYSSKEAHHSTKGHHTSKEDVYTFKESLHPPKEYRSKDSHTTTKENHNTLKDTHHSEIKDSKPVKPPKGEKEAKPPSKRPLVSESHGTHGAPEKKKRHISASSDNSEKTADYPKPKVKDGKEKTEKGHKSSSSIPNKTFVKKEKEKPKHKINSIPPEIKEAAKMKPLSPVRKPPSPPRKMPSPVRKPPSPPPWKPPSPLQEPPSPILKEPVDEESRSPSPSSSDSEMDSDSDDSRKSFSNKSVSDESKKSFGNKAHYSSPASSISETSLDGNRPSSSMMRDNDLFSSSDAEEEEDNFPSHVKRLSSSSESEEEEMQMSSPEPQKPPEPPRPPKIEKKHHSSHKSSKHKSSKHPYKGNGSLSNSNHVPVSPYAEERTIPNNNNNMNSVPRFGRSDREELIELQQKIMSSDDKQLLQKIVDVIEKTGKYEVSTSSFDFDLCSLDHVTVKKLKHCLLA